MPGGFKQSAIRLNIPLQILDTWNEEEILNRSKNSIKQAYKIWPYPKVKQEILEKYKPEKKTKRNKKTIITPKTEYWTLLKEKLDENPLFKKTNKKPQNKPYFNFPFKKYPI